MEMTTFSLKYYLQERKKERKEKRKKEKRKEKIRQTNGKMDRRDG